MRYVADGQLTPPEAELAVADSRSFAGAEIKLGAALRQKQQAANARFVNPAPIKGRERLFDDAPACVDAVERQMHAEGVVSKPQQEQIVGLLRSDECLLQACAVVVGGCTSCQQGTITGASVQQVLAESRHTSDAS